jgi:natural product precursor
MKKKIQKLTLSKETLRSLEETNLAKVAGGTLENSCVGSCRCTDRTIPCSVCCR